MGLLTNSIETVHIKPIAIISFTQVWLIVYIKTFYIVTIATVPISVVTKAIITICVISILVKTVTIITCNRRTVIYVMSLIVKLEENNSISC